MFICWSRCRGLIGLARALLLLGMSVIVLLWASCWRIFELDFLRLALSSVDCFVSTAYWASLAAAERCTPDDDKTMWELCRLLEPKLLNALCFKAALAWSRATLSDWSCMIFLCCLFELLLVVSRGLSAVVTVEAAAAFCSMLMDAVCCFSMGICCTLEETELQ